MRPYTEKALRFVGRTIRAHWVATGSWLLPTLFVYYSFAGSAAYQACVAEPPKQEADHPEAKKTPTIPHILGGFVWTRWECSGAFVEANHEEIIALFTVILAVVTGTLWRSTERLVRGAEDTSERQLRAYVLVESGSVELIRGVTPSLTICFKNYGQTPASDVCITVDGRIGPWPLRDALPFRNRIVDETKTIIAPNSKVTFFYNLPSVSTETARQLGTGKATVYAYGEANYRDAFGVPRRTKYRLIAGGPEGWHGGQMASDGAGNEYT